jgi:hypothetical protein
MSKPSTPTARRLIGPGLVAKTCADALVKRWLQKLARGDRAGRKHAKVKIRMG